MKPHEVPYPNNCNYAIYGPYIGQLVVHKHSSGKRGVILGVSHGCNGLLDINWLDGHTSETSPSDVALERLYPKYNWPHEVPEEQYSPKGIDMAQKEPNEKYYVGSRPAPSPKPSQTLGDLIREHMDSELQRATLDAERKVSASYRKEVENLVKERDEARTELVNLRKAYGSVYEKKVFFRGELWKAENLADNRKKRIEELEAQVKYYESRKGAVPETIKLLQEKLDSVHSQLNSVVKSMEG